MNEKEQGDPDPNYFYFIDHKAVSLVVWNPNSKNTLKQGKKESNNDTVARKSRWKSTGFFRTRTQIPAAPTNVIDRKTNRRVPTLPGQSPQADLANEVNPGLQKVPTKKPLQA